MDTQVRIVIDSGVEPFVQSVPRRIAATEKATAEGRVDSDGKTRSDREDEKASIMVCSLHCST